MPIDQLIPIAGAIAQLGVAGVVILGFLLLVVGILRVGKLVDGERIRIIEERDKREAAQTAEWLRRETLLIADRDAWKARAESVDQRLDRVAAAFTKLTNAPAPD